MGNIRNLIPIVVAGIPGKTNETMMIISISASLWRELYVEIIVPLFRIQRSWYPAERQCNHVNHVPTQLPYAATVAVVSCTTLCNCRICSEYIDLSSHRLVLHSSYSLFGHEEENRKPFINDLLKIKISRDNFKRLFALHKVCGAKVALSLF